MKEKFFTTEQVANILQVHPFTILKFIKQGKLIGLKLGRVYRIKESDVEKFIEERMTNSETKKEKKVKDEKVETKFPKTMPVEVKINNSSDDDHYYII